MKNPMLTGHVTSQRIFVVVLTKYVVNIMYTIYEIQRHLLFKVTQC